MSVNIETRFTRLALTDNPQRDSWHSCTGLSRTEAKRRYITTLISTMHKYASPSPDARELVSELEFVWDQVKSNVPSSSSSSPLQTLGMPAGFSTIDKPPPFPKLDTSHFRSPMDTGEEKDGLRVMSPMSQSEEEAAEAEEAAEQEGEVFVDARDSQIAEPPPRCDDISQQDSQEGKGDRYRPPDSGVALSRDAAKRSSYSSPREPRWRLRVESALVKLTAEVAALREQLESRRLFSLSKQHRIWQYMVWSVWGLVKHVAFDFLLLAVVLLWMRRKKDRRLEMAIRVLLGDAVAEARRIGGSVGHAVVGNKKG
jgi:hypothetical protein